MILEKFRMEKLLRTFHDISEYYHRLNTDLPPCDWLNQHRVLHSDWLWLKECQTSAQPFRTLSRTRYRHAQIREVFTCDVTHYESRPARLNFNTGNPTAFCLIEEKTLHHIYLLNADLLKLLSGGSGNVFSKNSTISSTSSKT